MRVLIVEDEPKIANAVKRGLEQETFSVDAVYDGDSGLSYAESDDYDLVILDWMLPGSVDGIEICRQLRDQGIKTPILMLTAKDTVENRVDGLNTGADDYLIKPFSFEELLARVRALLRRPSNDVQLSIEVDDLIINPTTVEVTRNGTLIMLTSKEFALLEYLARNKGQVLSKDKLIQHVWNEEADTLPNTVEVYIGYLRNKIDKPFKKPLIHTVRGFGYRMGDVK